ncbi:MAG: PHP domain-containing protein [Thermodesulfobacteriota bacterium]|nr:PHP domain-containing protein [Thermodesulfobacteriota bacterium]
MPGIDLHTHSTASDGTFSPAEVVRMAFEAGLEAVALTDHDTTSGLPEAVKTGRELGIEVVPGCELSVTSETGFMHIVGLFLPENPKGLIQAMEYLRERRHSRNIRIVEKMRAVGLDVNYEEVVEFAKGESVGRPHLAGILLKKGYVSSIQEAFDEYLGEGGKVYLPKDKFTPEKGLPALKAEGATVILAHPYTLELEGQALEAKVRELKDLGLDGMECHYSEHTPEMTSSYLALVRKLDLVVSGGSDFHGQAKPEISLGVGRGDLFIPYSVLQAIKDRRRAQGLGV